jgi:hypothetical protein
MLQRLKRRRGGQPGNINALKSGKWSERLKAAAAEARRARAEEERKRFEAWSAPIEARCRLQTARVLDELKRLRAEQEAADYARAHPLK